MKNAIKAIVSGIALTCLVAAPGYAATITWDGGGGDDNWSTGDNWSGTPDNTSPVDGDSVVLTPTAQSRLDYSLTIESGQSLTSTTSGFGDEVALVSSGDLTLATGGIIDIGFMRPRFSSGGQFTIEPGATLDTDNYGLGSTSASITFIADANGVTLWDSAGGQFQMGGDNLIVDLTNYDFSNGNTLTLVDYGDTSGQTFASVSVLGAPGFTIDYGSGTNDAITLTAIPEASTLALFGLGAVGLCLCGRRRQR